MSAAKGELVERRRGLVARRRELKAEMTRLAQDIAALDKVLLMLDPDYKPEVGNVNRRGMVGDSPFGHGETTTLALAALRELGRRPATATEGRSRLGPLLDRVQAMFTQDYFFPR